MRGPPNVYRFEDLTLDVQNRRLTRRGVEIYLPPKTFETLLVLVQHHGHLVTKQALLDAVWSDTAVTANALTQQISDLRDVLGDDARRPRFIRTLPRVGFTFIAPVEADPPTTVPEARPSGNAVAPASPRLALRVGAALGVALLVVAAGSAWFGMRPVNPLGRLELVSSRVGLHRSPSLSPDGHVVAFLSDRSGTAQVWTKALASGEPVQVTFHDHAVSRPRWSAQGNQIVYSVQGMGIWSVSATGGPPRQLVAAGRNPDLSPDGRVLVFERPWAVWIANADGTNQRRLPMMKEGYLAHYGDAWPTFSPDGKHIALFLATEGPYGDYWLVPAAGGEPRRLTSDEAEGGPPAWTHDGRHLIVSSGRSGSLSLWRIPVAGGAPEALTAGTGDDLEPAVSKDGRRVVFVNVKRSWSVVVHDTRNDRRRTAVEARTSLGSPRFSWDGRRLAFHGRTEAGDTHVFVADADGANIRPLTTGRRELNIMPQWAHTDSAVLYYQVRPRQNLRRIPVTTGPFEDVADWRWDREHEASTDPSSARIVYSVLEHGQLRETRVRRLDDGSETALPMALFEPQFSRDGRRIAGESPDQTVTICEIAGACRAITPKIDRGLTSLGWSADGARIFYLQRTDRPGWGELKSIGADGSTLRSHGIVGPLRPYEMLIGVSPLDEVAFAPYREGPHELWTAQLR